MNKSSTSNKFPILYPYLILFSFLLMLLTGCGAKSTDECYTPIAAEYHYEGNEICDICQYKNTTVLAHENGFACYDCVTGNLTENPLPISGKLIVSRYQDLLYILDKETKLIHEIDLHDFRERNTYQLGDEVGVINDFAVGKDYLLFYGMADDEFSLLSWNKESEHPEVVKTDLHIEDMTAMQDN